MKITIAIVDDHQLMLSGLESLLSNYSKYEIVFTAESGEAFLKNLSRYKTTPNIVLMDIDMKGINGFETIKKALVTHKDIKIILISTHYSNNFVEKAIETGAAGYLSKNETIDEICNAIDSVHHNGFYFNELFNHRRIMEYTKEGYLKTEFISNIHLTKREKDIIICTCEQKTDLEIAELLGLRSDTVSTYRKELMRKLGIKKSTGLVVYAIKNEIYIP